MIYPVATSVSLYVQFTVVYYEHVLLNLIYMWLICLKWLIHMYMYLKCLCHFTCTVSYNCNSIHIIYVSSFSVFVRLFSLFSRNAISTGSSLGIAICAHAHCAHIQLPNTHAQLPCVARCSTRILGFLLRYLSPVPCRSNPATLCVHTCTHHSQTTSSKT